MKPVLFTWRGITIHSYPAMQYVGLVLGVLVSNNAAYAAGIDPFRTFVATFILLMPALGGARLLFVATHWSEFKHRRSQIWNVRKGGAAQYGGILLAVPLSVPLLRALNLPFGEFWDVSMFTIMVGMVFTRFGCLLNGCCAGRPSHSRISLYLPDARGTWEQRIPTQLLEAAWAFVLLTVAVVVWPRLPFPGALFIVVSAGYAGGRLLMESTRVAVRRFTLHHAISLLIIALSVAALSVRGPE